MTSNIGCFPGDFTARFRVQLRNSLIDGTSLATADGHLGTLFEHHLGDGAADSSGRAGNEADFIGHMKSRIRREKPYN